MPDKALEAAELALLEAKDLVVEVRKANISQRVLMVIVSVLVVIVGLLAWGWIQTQHALRAEEKNSEADAAYRKQQALENCQNRNAANAGWRAQFNRQYDLTATLINTPEGADFVAKLKATIPPIEETDVDCDDSGSLDAADYPA